MSEIIQPGAGLIFMKIGRHAQEDLGEIIARKTEEIRRTGFGMWGYGGNTCHPSTMVQPFAREHENRGKTIYLCMEEMTSNHLAEPLCAKEFSLDGISWKEIPNTIQVRGSRYALVISNLHEYRFILPLDRTIVPVGPNMGRSGSRYIRGRVDKACLEVLAPPALSNEENPREVEINLVATLQDPYAVFLRGQR